MGFFTWTDARKYPKILKNGDYASVDKIVYGGYAKIVCPDNTEIIEPYYDGYGVFDNKDVYELVVDWNKKYLESIFNKLSKDDFGYRFKILAIAYQNNDVELINSEIERLISEEQVGHYIREDWKRNIGVAISCGKNEKLPFPIKITSTKRHKKYDELVPSFSCQ